MLMGAAAESMHPTFDVVAAVAFGADTSTASPVRPAYPLGLRPDR